MATVNSKARATRWKIGAVLMVLLAGALLAGETQRRIFAARADAEFQRAQARFRAAPDNPTNAWQFARAAFECAEFADSDTRRSGLAAQGMAACRQSLAREPKSAAAHYYLAMNLGQQARTEFLGVLKMRLRASCEGGFYAEKLKPFPNLLEPVAFLHRRICQSTCAGLPRRRARSSAPYLS